MNIINDFIYDKYENMYTMFPYNEDGFKFGDEYFPTESHIEDYSQITNICLKNIIDSEVDNHEIFEYLYNNLEILLTDEDANKQNLYYLIERCYGYFENNFIVEPSINPTIDLKVIILQSIFNYIRAFPTAFITYLLTLSENEINEMSKLMNNIEKEKVYPPQLLFKAILKISMNNQTYADILVNLILQPTSVIVKFIHMFSNTSLLDNYIETLFKYISLNEEMVYLSKEEVIILIELKKKNIVNLSQTTQLINEKIISQLPSMLSETCLNSYTTIKK